MEYPKVALPGAWEAHAALEGPHRQPRPLRLRHGCSRDLNLSTRMTFRRDDRSVRCAGRVRDLSWSGGARVSSRCVEAHFDAPELNASPESTVVSTYDRHKLNLAGLVVPCE